MYILETKAIVWHMEQHAPPPPNKGPFCAGPACPPALPLGFSAYSQFLPQFKTLHVQFTGTWTMKLPPRSERESTECGLMEEGRWIQIQSTEEEEENDFVAALHIHAN